MATYKTDQRDILFNLNDVLKVQEHSQYGFDESSVKEIITEYDKFVENRIYPIRASGDEEGVKLTPTGVQAPKSFKEVTREYYEMGWFALGVPEEVGGSPVPHALSTACLSLSAGANTAWSMYPGLSKGAFTVLRLLGDEYLKTSCLTPMIEGKFGGTMCLTEASAGSDVGALKTTAKPIEGKENWFSIKGTKIFISSGDNDIYENIIHLVLARTPEGKPGPKGLSLFMVPKYRINSDGSNGELNDVVCSGVEHKMGIHASATCTMNFGDADKCEGYLIGKEFDGMQNMFIMMNEARLDVGIQGESSANLAFQMTKQYVEERTQFGTPIVNHPDVKRTMLKMRSMSRGLRSLMLYTSDLFDKAKEDQKYEDYIGLLVPICKSFGSDAGFNVCVDAVQCHGGYGYCTEYGIEQFVRDVKIASIYEGTNAIQAIDFVMRKILKDKGVTLRAIADDVFKTSNKLSDDFSFERGIFSKAIAASSDAMGVLAKKAKKNEMNFVLQNCSDFLELSSHIVIAWRLMESAWVAGEKLSTASSEEEKEFLNSKIVDFKIYCAHYLVESIARAKTIVSFEEDISQFKV